MRSNLPIQKQPIENFAADLQAVHCHKTLLELLIQYQIRFLVGGSWATCYYGARDKSKMIGSDLDIYIPPERFVWHGIKKMLDDNQHLTNYKFEFKNLSQLVKPSVHFDLDCFFNADIKTLPKFYKFNRAFDMASPIEGLDSEFCRVIPVSILLKLHQSGMDARGNSDSTKSSNLYNDSITLETLYGDVILKDLEMSAVEAVININRKIAVMINFWKEYAVGWADVETSQYLEKIDLENINHLAASLNIWIDIDKANSNQGVLMLAFVNLGAIVENISKLFIAIYRDDYLKEPFAKRKTKPAEVHQIKLDEIIGFFEKEFLWCFDSTSWMRDLQKKRNAIHVFHPSVSIGTWQEFYQSVITVDKFISDIDSMVPYP